MIEVTCPYCKNDIEITNDMTIYNMNRLGESVHECGCCGKKMRIWYDGGIIGGTIKVSRICKK